MRYKDLIAYQLHWKNVTYTGIRERGNEMKAVDEIIEEARVALLDGLTTDGEHHKQYYLEKVFRLLCGDEHVDKEKSIEEWEEGIPG